MWDPPEETTEEEEYTIRVFFTYAFIYLKVFLQVENKTIWMVSTHVIIYPIRINLDSFIFLIDYFPNNFDLQEEKYIIGMVTNNFRRNYLHNYLILQEEKYTIAKVSTYVFIYQDLNVFIFRRNYLHNYLILREEEK